MISLLFILFEITLAYNYTKFYYLNDEGKYLESDTFGICGMDWFLNEYGVCERCWDYDLCPGLKHSYPCSLSYYRFLEEGAEEIYPLEVIDQAKLGCGYFRYSTLLHGQ